MAAWKAGAQRLITAVLVLVFLLGFSVMPARAQEDPGFAPQHAQERRELGAPDSRRAAAEGQFERAEAMRQAFEAKAERERSLRDYENLVNAYRRVYLITPNAVQVPPAIKQVADLYRRMGEQFEPKYFDEAIKTYEYLAHDYPESSLREGALIAIAEIRQKNLAQRDLARENYEDYLRQYPHSSLAAQARKAIAQIQGESTQAKAKPEAEQAAPAPVAIAPAAAAVSPYGSANAGTSSLAGAAASGATAETSGQDSEVSHVRVWNADSYTRIIIDLGGKAKYQAARISDPDRIYFDIENAKLSAELLHEPIAVPAGSYLKAVRVAQNRADVVRVVLDVAKVKDYSVFELADPDRLVVDVYGPTQNAAPVASVTANSAAKANVQPAKSGNTAAVNSAPKSVRPDAVPSAALGPLPFAAKDPASLVDMPALPKAVASAAPPESLKTMAENIGPAPAAKPTRSGEHSLTRVLGLKIGRIVIDPGHGGHDTGTIGPTGLMEKDLCLDVALRLGKLIARNLPSAEIVYTRQDDRFVGLEQRTAIANEARADLFLSIHANSSDDPKVSGIETYYLNLNPSAQAMEVAARENAATQSSVHDLQDLVTKIARNEKVEESRDLAADIQESMASSMQIGSRPERNRGVRKAPFIVLVGADMPSVLAEISFISNPADEQWLKKPENRQHAAEGLYRGIEKYLHSVNSLTTTISPTVNSPRAQ
jgi:N-acetylmuramoyl-L-alanine amidase